MDRILRRALKEKLNYFLNKKAAAKRIKSYRLKEWAIYDLKNWRKINAPRADNKIESIPLEVWENGIKENEGFPIKK